MPALSPNAIRHENRLQSALQFTGYQFPAAARRDSLVGAPSTWRLYWDEGLAPSEAVRRVRPRRGSIRRVPTPGERRRLSITAVIEEHNAAASGTPYPNGEIARIDVDSADARGIDAIDHVSGALCARIQAGYEAAAFPDAASISIEGSGRRLRTRSVPAACARTGRRRDRTLNVFSAMPAGTTRRARPNPRNPLRAAAAPDRP